MSRGQFCHEHWGLEMVRVLGFVEITEHAGKVRCVNVDATSALSSTGSGFTAIKLKDGTGYLTAASYASLIHKMAAARAAQERPAGVGPAAGTAGSGQRCSTGGAQSRQSGR